MPLPLLSPEAIFASRKENRLHRAFLLALECLYFFTLCMVLPYPVTAAEKAVKRIGYLEAGRFWLFDRTYAAFKTSLARQQQYQIDYPQNAHGSPGWEPENMKKLPALAEALMQRKDLDLVVGMGTAGVKALLAANNGRTPILGMGLADPIAAGLVFSAKDSGVDNFTCPVVPDRWKTMLRVFHDVVHFKKLGIMYPNTPEGLVYSALKDARIIATELGFEVLEYSDLSSAEAEEECRQGLTRLYQQGMDAFFIGPLNCFDQSSKAMPDLLKLLNGWNIPTFARDGSDFVRAGALMGFSTWNFEPTGQFLANQAMMIFGGAKPRDVPMLDKMEPTIAINLETASTIGFIFPLDVLVVSDEIFEHIDTSISTQSP